VATRENSIVIGTRGSPLALAQANLTARLLRAARGWDDEAIRLDIIRTTGDIRQDRPLSEIGGKGLFTKEIDQAQLEGRVDLAVHSAKDLPTALPEGLAIAGYLEREDIRDALIAPRAKTLKNLPKAARIGTVSLRRQSLLRHMRPDLIIEPLRGNVETRLSRAADGSFDGVVLAMAGLRRLGLEARVTEALDPLSFVPAVGQGAIALVIRADDERLRRLLTPILHLETGIELAAERAFLAELDGNCRTPIGGSARVLGSTLVFRGIVLSPDGSALWREEAEARWQPGDHAEALERSAGLGHELGLDLRRRMPGIETGD
jgi:hydroxymethylbilane synthase